MQYTAITILIFVTTTLVAADKEHNDSHDDDVGYKFGYGVYDPHTHDMKSHHEERHGKHVVGYYTLKDPDGTTRVVHYKAGPHTGFEAFVEIIGHPHYDDHGHGKKKDSHDDHHGHGEDHHDHHDHGKPDHHDHHDHGKTDNHDYGKRLHHGGHHDHDRKDHNDRNSGHGYAVHEDHDDIKFFGHQDGGNRHY